MNATIKATESEVVIHLATGVTISQRKHGPYEVWLPGGRKLCETQGNHALRTALHSAISYYPATSIEAN
jgi:hypothetical protein